MPSEFDMSRASSKTAWSTTINKTHTAQAIWWLNAFWEETEIGKGAAQQVWDAAHAMVEVETGKKLLYGKSAVEVNEGCSIPMLQAHKFLELMDNHSTPKELKEKIAPYDLDDGGVLNMSIYLLAFVGQGKKSPADLMTAPQGDVGDDALQQAEAAAAAATKLLHDAEELKEKSDAAEAEITALKAEADAATAKSEAIRAEVAASEKAFNDKLAALDAKGTDPNLGAVKRGKAQAEAASMRDKEDLPLTKLKITLEAQLKHVHAANDKVDARYEGVKAAAKEANDAYEAATASFEQASKEFKELTHEKGSGIPYGKVWWMEKVLEEKMRFMPTKK